MRDTVDDPDEEAANFMYQACRIMRQSDLGAEKDIGPGYSWGTPGSLGYITGEYLYVSCKRQKQVAFGDTGRAAHGFLYEIAACAVDKVWCKKSMETCLGSCGGNDASPLAHSFETFVAKGELSAAVLGEEGLEAANANCSVKQSTVLISLFDGGDSFVSRIFKPHRFATVAHGMVAPLHRKRSPLVSVCGLACEDASTQTRHATTHGLSVCVAFSGLPSTRSGAARTLSLAGRFNASSNGHRDCASLTASLCTCKVLQARAHRRIQVHPLGFHTCLLHPRQILRRVLHRHVRCSRLSPFSFSNESHCTNPMSKITKMPSPVYRFHFQSSLAQRPSAPSPEKAQPSSAPRASLLGAS